MKNNKTRTVSTRISIDEFAKARDGMIARGVAPDKLESNSAILRTAVLMCCLLTEDPKLPASKESTEIIKQLWRITKRVKNIDLDSLY